MAIVAERRLSQQGFRPLLPLTSRGQPVFGPYIFIELDLDREEWRSVNATRGVQKLLPIACETPLPLPVGFVDELRERMRLGEFGDEEARELVYAYAKDQTVTITSGPFEALEGKFVRRQKGFVNISLLLFGRAVEVFVPSHQVKPASAEINSRASAAAMRLEDNQRNQLPYMM